MAIKPKEFTLSDGSVWPAPALAFEIGITQTACRYRLEQTNDVEVIMRSKYNPKKLNNKPYKCKKFTLSDGTIMSAEEVAIKYNINKSTMYARLLRGVRDIDILSRKPKPTLKGAVSGYVKLAYQPKEIKDVIMDRNFFNPLDHLWLKQKNI